MKVSIETFTGNKAIIVSGVCEIIQLIEHPNIKKIIIQKSKRADLMMDNFCFNLEENEKRLVEEALLICDNRQDQASTLLGITSRMMCYKVKKYKLNNNGKRSEE